MSDPMCYKPPGKAFLRRMLFVVEEEGSGNIFSITGTDLLLTSEGISFKEDYYEPEVSYGLMTHVSAPSDTTLTVKLAPLDKGFMYRQHASMAEADSIGFVSMPKFLPDPVFAYVALRPVLKEDGTEEFSIFGTFQTLKEAEQAIQFFSGGRVATMTLKD